MFEQKGYVIVHIDDIDRFYQQAGEDAKWSTIFNGKSGLAGGRWQCTVDEGCSNCALYKELFDLVISKVPELAGYRYLNCQILVSDSRSRQQQLHTDFECEGGLSMIASLDIGTKLIVRPFGEDVERQIMLDKGDCILFSGKLPHRGAAYSKANTRLHMYGGLEGVEAPDDMTYIVS